MLVKVDKLSLHRRYQFRRKSDGLTVFRGHTHFVGVDMAQGRVRRMPERFLSTYSGAVAPEHPGHRA